MFKAFLNHIVPEDILHQCDDLGLHLPIHCHDVLWRGICQLLLYESAAMLVSAELKHEAFDVLQQKEQIDLL